MSRHIFKHNNLAVHMGWDKPMMNYYATVYDMSVEEDTPEWFAELDKLYDQLNDKTFYEHFYRGAKPAFQLDYLLKQVAEVCPASLPEQMLVNLREDMEYNRVNAETKYYGDETTLEDLVRVEGWKLEES